MDEKEILTNTFGRNETFFELFSTDGTLAYIMAAINIVKKLVLCQDYDSATNIFSMTMQDEMHDEQIMFKPTKC